MVCCCFTAWQTRQWVSVGIVLGHKRLKTTDFCHQDKLFYIYIIALGNNVILILLVCYWQ